MILRTKTHFDGCVRIKLDCDTKSCERRTWITIPDADLGDLPGPEERPRGRVRARLARYGWTTPLDETGADNRTFCPTHSVIVRDDDEIIDDDDVQFTETPFQARKRMLREKAERAEQRRAKQRQKYADKRNPQ
ncbi:hypothetical protein AU099_gp83 [Gordonia phage GTE8]|uniref:Uncharacterized protein n=1 Tax=Gordonia phage GTE8 TaxID=1647475 RepID=A0A0K0N704_9CAUD|nr:hypothetical protein AU099_gp83 [Gordonia phage GTE8]AKJ72426.1 hypothetical protein GTE8_83 [Gordonia phage GTE8]